MLTWPVFSDHPVSVVVTTRDGGVSDGPYATLNLGLHVGDDAGRVLENRRRAARAAGLELEDLVFCRQTHGRQVATVTRAEAGKGAGADGDAIQDTDGLVTAEPGVGLVMMAADCSPIVLYDPDAPALACVHSGWRGTTARVVEAALGAMAELGAHPRRVIAAIGPTVAASTYQVGPEVVEAARDSFDDLDGLIEPDGSGRWKFDLVAANVRILTEAGVPPGHIHRAGVDTGAAQCFSDRGERPCGRQAAIVALRA